MLVLTSLTRRVTWSYVGDCEPIESDRLTVHDEHSAICRRRRALANGGSSCSCSGVPDSAAYGTDVRDGQTTRLLHSDTQIEINIELVRVRIITRMRIELRS